MRLKGQHTTKPKDALGLYIDQRTIALCVVRDSAVDSAEGKHVLLLTHVGHHPAPIERTAESLTDRLVQEVTSLCADALGDTAFALGCWTATGQARCFTVPLATLSHPEDLLHLDAAEQVSDYVATHVSQRVDQGASFAGGKSLSQSSWLDDARPKEPPVFDYALRKRQDEADAVEAWIWWASGESEIALKKAMARAGTPVEGLIPDGIALYRGLLHFWQENGVSPDCLQGEWVLIDDSTPNAAWFFCDCWFQVRKQYDNDDIIRDPEINRRCTAVIWGWSNDAETFLFEGEAVFDHLLRPHGVGGQASPVSESVSSLIALGLALQGVEPRVSEWHHAGDSPAINLLPWRGQRLQQLRSRLFAQIGIAAALVTALTLSWAGVLSGRLTDQHEYLSTLAEQLELRERAERQVEQQQKNWRQDERTRDYLVRLAGTGERQLDYLQRVLELIPECASLTKVVLSGTSISVSGIAGDSAELRSLPENLFAAFAEDGKNILNAWPLLLADTSGYGQSGQHDEQERFVLQVSFDKTPKAPSSEVAQSLSTESLNEESLNRESSNRESSNKETLVRERWHER